MSKIDKLILELKSKYSTAVQNIVLILQKDVKTRDKAQYEKYLKKEIKNIQVELNDYGSKWVKKSIPASYYIGSDRANTTLKKVGRVASRSALLHKTALGQIIDDAVMLLHESNYFFARQIYDDIRSVTIELANQKLARGDTVQHMRNRLLENLQKQGVRGVRTKDGKYIQVDAYASMVARATTRESTNLGVINQTTESGHDLVQISTHYPTCSICAPFQGRIYSVSGKDKRFPSLKDTAFASGYANIHPNCRHVLMPVVWDLLDNEEQLRHLEQAKQPFMDLRTAKEKSLYDSQQRDNRERRRDLLQWRRYQQRLGKEYTPKTFAGFRRMKKYQSHNWKIMQSQYRGMGYYNKATKNEPSITKVVKSIANKVNMKPAGLEFRVKSKHSYLRKIRSNYSPDGNEYEVTDILRYTYVSKPETMVDSTLKSVDEYNKIGYNTVGVKNYWLIDSNPYKGVNTVIRAPSGQKFELQYHTPESLIAKEEIHPYYEEWRLIKDGDPKKDSLIDVMFDITDDLTPPKDIDKVR